MKAVNYFHHNKKMFLLTITILSLNELNHQQMQWFQILLRIFVKTAGGKLVRSMGNPP
jgi:hypothetical protein